MAILRFHYLLPFSLFLLLLINCFAFSFLLSFGQHLEFFCVKKLSYYQIKYYHKSRKREESIYSNKIRWKRSYLESNSGKQVVIVYPIRFSKPDWSKPIANSKHFPLFAFFLLFPFPVSHPVENRNLCPVISYIGEYFWFNSLYFVRIYSKVLFITPSGI